MEKLEQVRDKLDAAKPYLIGGVIGGVIGALVGAVIMGVVNSYLSATKIDNKF